ncbi:MAG TPA: D-glycerate dehydrogenase [Planctomycetota bacterium]|nr:D-glycerate dehydrogenase [Planctomycetota bacterium]
MGGFSIFVTRALPEEGLEPLRTARDVARLDVSPLDRPLGRDELLRELASRDGAIVLLMDRIDDELLGHLPRLRAIGCFSVGTDNVDLEAARRRGVSVANAPDVLTDATADMAFALLLACARRVVEGDSIVRTGKFEGWSPLYHLGLDVSGKTLGVLGAGRIGQALLRRARGFGMRLLYTSREAKPEIDCVGAERVSKETLLRESDFVSVHLALAKETRHAIDEAALSLMKPTAVLVNTARGPIVDERALVRALRERRIFGAGLDVFEDEPALAPGLAELPNVVLAPHVGSATRGTRAGMARLAATGLLALLRGETPPNWVPGSARPVH